MPETCVWSLGWEDPLEKGMDTHSSIPARRIPWTFTFFISTTLSFPHCVHKSNLYSFPTNRFINTIFLDFIYMSSVQLLSCVRFFVIPWTAVCLASLSITNTRSLLKLISIELVMRSNHLILCYPLLLPPSIFSSIRNFSSESVLCIRWPKYWSFSFNISPSNEYSGLISFRMDWLNLLGTLKSLLQHHSSKASIL